MCQKKDLIISTKFYFGLLQMTEENGPMESSEDTNQNSIASSLLTLVEMITSAEQGGSLPPNAQQVQVRPNDHYSNGSRVLDC